MSRAKVKLRKKDIPHFPLRTPHLSKVKKVADEEKRSVNAHIEYLIEKDLKERGIDLDD
jgi:hypothetical protein